MDWVGVSETTVLVLIVLVAVPLGLLFVRRRWLGRSGGSFDVSCRLHHKTPGLGWALGVARYDGEFLEWFRTFSLSWRPRVRLERRRTGMVSQRRPEAAELLALLPNQQIVLFEDRLIPSERQEFAMSEESLTGLLSWLEAAPPGLGRYPGAGPS